MVIRGKFIAIHVYIRKKLKAKNQWPEKDRGKKKQQNPLGRSMKGIIKIKVQTLAKSKKNIEKTKQKLAL